MNRLVGQIQCVLYPTDAPGCTSCFLPGASQLSVWPWSTNGLRMLRAFETATPEQGDSRASSYRRKGVISLGGMYDIREGKGNDGISTGWGDTGWIQRPRNVGGNNQRDIV